MMRAVIVLAVLIGITIADDGCVCQIHSRSKRAVGPGGGVASWDFATYAKARIEAQGVRIALIAKQIDELSHHIHDDDDHDYNLAVNELERRLDHFEGDDCHDHQFCCGRNSGQCISDLLVCDHVNDCKNGHDEDSHVCQNQVPAGRSWSGRANWNSCITRHHNEMTLLITGNRRMDHFPTRLFVDAVIIEKWTEDHEEHTQTWTSHGYWSFADTHLVLGPPDGSEKRIGMKCEDAGEGIADCKMLRESDLHECGHAVLTRSV